MADRKYTADDIHVLQGLEGVRKRPAMYIGSTNATGLHHLVWEIVDNAVDEALSGFGDKIIVTIHKDGSCSVLDEGRGIPCGINRETGRPAVELVFTELHAGGKFNSAVYKSAAGLPVMAIIWWKSGNMIQEYCLIMVLLTNYHYFCLCVTIVMNVLKKN